MQFIVNRLFIEINISQSSVATYAKNGRIFNNQLAANLPRNLPVKTLRKSVKFDRIMAMSLWPHFFGPLCTKCCLDRIRSRTAIQLRFL